MRISNPATAPSSYDQFFREYTSYVQGLVVQLGINASDAEDVAADILVAFLERDGLKLYDPNRISERTGERVTFKTYINVHVRAQIRKRLDKQYKRMSREVSYDVIAGPNTPGGGLGERSEQFSDYLRGPDSQAERDFENILTQTDMHSLKTHLSTMRPSSTSSTTLADLLEEVLDTFACNERNSKLPNFPELGSRIDLSRNGARRWYRILETEILSWYASKRIEEEDR